MRSDNRTYKLDKGKFIISNAVCQAESLGKYWSLRSYELPVVVNLVPALSDEREAAEAVLYSLRNCHLVGDKGFVGQAWQAKIYEHTGNRIWPPKRSNQYGQNRQALYRLLVSMRERVEGIFTSGSTQVEIWKTCWPIPSSA